MAWFTELVGGNSVEWLLVSTLIALLAGLLSSWLTYRLVKRKEMLDKVTFDERSEKKERIRQEVIRWANPIFGSVISLHSKLNNILYHHGYLALSSDYEGNINTNWSISYDYFMNSSLFLFGQYFAWIRMFEEKLSFELFESQKEKDEFTKAIRSVSKALGSFPTKSYTCSGQDTQVFNLQQRAIGELFIVGDNGNRRCITYPEFLEKQDNWEFSRHLEPLRNLLERITPDTDCRWKRLEAVRMALVYLESQCRELLVLPKK